jgi:pyridoxamine 5'-phosphate oxidase
MADVRRFHHLRREYGRDSLGPDDLDPNPIAQFAAWFKVAEASEIVEPNAMTIATVDEAGCPDARIVLLKELRGDGFVFYTNYDSAKGRQLSAGGRAAIVFYWDRLERQVRATGIVERIAPADSDAYFESRPVKSRIAAAASPQSRRVRSRAELESAFSRVAARVDADGGVRRPKTWGGFILRPSTLEFWQGRRSRLHDRLRYVRADDGWTIERLAP